MKTPNVVKFLQFATKTILQEEDNINPMGFVITPKGIGMVPLPFQDKSQALKVFGSAIKQSNSEEAVLVVDVVTKAYEPNQKPISPLLLSETERDNAILMLHVEVKDHKDLNFHLYMQPYVKAMEGYAFADKMISSDRIDEAFTGSIKEGFLTN